jgi:3-hydroxyacyl-[acyl-carrier-protein] dehydratase
MERVKFRKQVIPGDQLRMVAEVVKLRGSIGKLWAEALVDGQVVAEAEFMFALTSEK